MTQARSDRVPHQASQIDRSDASATMVNRAIYVIHMGSPMAAPLVAAIRRSVSGEEVAIVDDEGEPGTAFGIEGFSGLPPEARSRFRVIAGDFSYGLHNGTPVPYSYVAMLRDPVARVLDLHRAFLALRDRGGTGAEDGHQLARAATSLESFVFEQRHLSVDNGMVRSIAGRRRLRFGQCPDDLLAEAKAHIESDFEALLLAEEMRMSAGILEHLLDVDLSALSQAILPPPDTIADEVDSGVIDRIRTLNRLDLQLYELARDAFHDTHARLAGQR